MTYAAKTWVSSENSRAEIERTLQRYGATSFAYGWQGTQAMIGFRLKDRTIRFLLPMPDPNSKDFTMTAAGRRRRDPVAAQKAWEQSCRSRWRALALCIKAKLEACEAGIATIEDEFLAQTVLPGGSTVGDWAKENVTNALASGKVTLLQLPGTTS